MRSTFSFKRSQSQPEPEVDMQVETAETEPHPVKYNCGSGIGLAQMSAKQLKAYHEQLRSTLPILTYNDIRRHRLPYYVSMCYELEEEGLPESAIYIKKVIQFNSDMRAAAGPDTVIWRRQKLKDNHLFLDKLRKGLSEAEKAQQVGNLAAECDALLELAIFFMHDDESWWWLAEHIFTSCIVVIDGYKGDGSKREAIARYIYGLFLLNQLVDVDEAEMQLQLARQYSEGKTWTAEIELNRSQESVFIETCTLLYKALLLLGIRCRADDPKKSIKLCIEGLKRAITSEKPKAKTESLFELGLSYQQDDNPESALETFIDYLNLCEELEDNEGICNAYMEIAICYKNMGNADETLINLHKFKEIAETEQLTERQAEAHRYLGEFHLNLGSPELATPHLNISFSFYIKLGMLDEIEQVRAIACIAAGQELVPNYAQLVMDSQGNSRNIIKLLKWKDMRIQFWVDSRLTVQLETITDVLDELKSITEEESLSETVSQVVTESKRDEEEIEASYMADNDVNDDDPT